MSDATQTKTTFEVPREKILEARKRLKEFPTYIEGLNAAKNMGVDTSDIMDHINWAEAATRSFLKAFDPEYKEETK